MAVKEKKQTKAAKAKEDKKKRLEDEKSAAAIQPRRYVPRTGPTAPARTGVSLDVEAREVVIHAGRQELLYNATLKLNYGFKYGLIGRNGVGKSTLLREISQGNGQVVVPEHVNIMHVEQEVVGDDRTVLQTVLEMDGEREWLLAAEKKILAMEPDDSGVQPMVEGVDLMEIYERLDEMHSEEAETRAALILSGLGFKAREQNAPTKQFSGGWRMRIALAAALFVTPDLLLLDEPTNHLDVHAVTWLEEFLQTWEKTVVIVSHDRNFLNASTTHTIFLHRKRLWYYGGSYDTFLRVRAEQRANQESMATQQNRKVAHLQQFIARFGRGHKKMARQAQSRMKLLGKIQEEAVAVDYDDPYLKLDFPSAPELPPPCISVIDAGFGYHEDRPPLYTRLNFGIDCDSRVAIVGPNGAGKSTFLKLLDGSLQPVTGSVRRHPKLSMARFTQHHLEMLDGKEDSVTHMRKLSGIREDGTSDVTVEEARKYLGRFGLAGDLALQKVETLSGGQKSRLAFAELAWRKPHILLLDEPTNHLDLETIEGLAMALNQFEGGLVLVSHDDRLVSMVADELWVVMPGPENTTKPGTVTVFEGSFEEYRESLRDEMARKNLTKGGRIKRVK